MSLLSPRRSRAVAVTASAAVLVIGASLVTQASPAYADAMTITTVLPIKVAAGLANRVVVITGTNFDEDLIGGVTLGADPDCALLTSYVVSSATSISVKTPGNGTAGAPPGCAASSGGTAETVTIVAADLTTTLAAKTSAITFVPPPAIATISGSQNAVITENSSALPIASQVTQLNAAGNQIIRIKAGASFAFTGAGSSLSGTLGGKALTTVSFLSAADGPQTLTGAGDNGNTWIAKTGTSLTASATPTLTITQSAVSRSFTSVETGLTIVAVPTVTSLGVKEGKSGAATATTIVGTNFGTTIGEIGVTFCGVAAPAPSAVTATLITLVTPTAVAGLSPGLGLLTNSGVCPVVVTRTPSGGSALVSPVSTTSAFTFLDR
jgi:hypothetical protein